MPRKNRHEKNVPKHKKCSGTFSFIVLEILFYLATSQLSQADTVVTGEDSEVRTRWQEQEDVSVVLYRHWDAGRRRLVLADGSEVFLILPQGGSDREERLACWQKRQEVAVALAGNTIRVRASHAPERDAPSWLAPWMQKGIRAAWLAEDGCVLHEDGVPLAHPARYDARLGYVVK